MVRERRRHTAAFKFRVALEALEGSRTISQLSSEHGVHANLIRAWKRQLLEDGPEVFASNGERKRREREAQNAELYEQMAAARPLRLGRLKMELEWLRKKVARFGPGETAHGRKQACDAESKAAGRPTRA